MQSTLIRFIDSKYADSYLKGELYLSSLSKFWDYTKDKTPYNSKLMDEKMTNKSVDFARDRQDFSEGVIAQIPWDKISVYFGELRDHIIHDVRFRLSANKYCNVLCFFRIDAEDTATGLLDVENALYLLKSNGYNITAEQLVCMGSENVQRLVGNYIDNNPVLSTDSVHMIQLPTHDMNRFGAAVVVVKDQEKFEKRIISAVQRTGGHVILGDIRYHSLVDRVDPNTMYRHSVTIISSEFNEENNNKIIFAGDGVFDISILNGIDGIYWRGPMDKYDMYAHQKEWRICWLPNLRNYEDKILSVGPLDDLIDIVETKHIRTYLLKKYRGYYPGIVNSNRKSICGTESYSTFREYLKTIDGLGDFIAEIG